MFFKMNFKSFNDYLQVSLARRNVMLSDPCTFYNGGFGAANNFVIVLLDFKWFQHTKYKISKDLRQTNVRQNLVRFVAKAGARFG